MIVKIAFQVRVAPPQNFVAPYPEGEEGKDQVVYDHQSQYCLHLINWYWKGLFHMWTDDSILNFSFPRKM